jgi:deoxyribodipyrimidine photolyase-related protein
MTPNIQFLITREEFKNQFEKPPIMETFYRYMRKSRDILMMDGPKPYGGKWNYDHENRNFDKDHISTWSWKPKDHEYIEEAKEYFSARDLECDLPVTRRDALSLLSYFLEYHSQDFGRLEDAMYQDDAYVHHSLLSTAMNFGLLYPGEVIEAILGWHMPLSSQEGYIRQILGWREYMRQYYLAYYDDIYSQNSLDHHEKLPRVWWSYGEQEPIF